MMPNFCSISRYLESKELTPYLKDLITESSSPLKSVEADSAVDSSGFSTGIYQRWNDTKWGKIREAYGTKGINRKDWVKVHVMCGVRTNIVTSVEVTDAFGGDCPRFRPLVEATSRNFTTESVCADKAYLSRKNLKLVVSKAAKPYIPFKSNTTPETKIKDDCWRRMYHYYCYNQEPFMKHYHKRSNVETIFSMIKAKFGERLRSKTPTAQVNEVLCKVLAHNLCCVIQSIYELGIDADFGRA